MSAIEKSAVWGRFAAILAVLRPAFPDLIDLHVYGGGLLVAFGAWLAWPPAGFMIFGALLIFLGIRAE